MTKRKFDHLIPEAVEAYVNQGRHCRDIARSLGCSNGTVHNLLVRSGIRKRTRSEAKRLCVKKGKDSPCFKSGIRPDGYAVRREGKRNILRHREIASQVLGRPLSRDEVVHHCNDTRSDNRLVNLWVFPSQADHARFHKNMAVAQGTLFLAAQQVLSYGFPWNIQWRAR